MEAGMPLYGHELGEEINALSCGVDFAISLDKDQDEKGEKFIGMDALKATRAAGGPPRKLAGFFIEGKRSARQGMLIKQERQRGRHRHQRLPEPHARQVDRDGLPRRRAARAGDEG
jgi:glycine cleavage system aminomethyltransferase T